MTKLDSKGLEACPCCGSTQIRTQVCIVDSLVWCAYCGIQITCRNIETKDDGLDEAIKRWNTRAAASDKWQNNELVKYIDDRISLYQTHVWDDHRSNPIGVVEMLEKIKAAMQPPLTEEKCLYE